MRLAIVCLILCLTHMNLWAQTKQKNREQKPEPQVSYALWSVDDNQVIDEKNQNRVQPIASMTKLMSVLVTLRSELSLEEILTVTGRESSPRIRPGMRLTRAQLIDLALVSSDNLAARTLAETHPLGYSGFIAAMNQTALELGMTNTEYSDATGLLASNVSTTHDIRQLVLAAQSWPVFQPAAMAKSVIIEATATAKKKLQPVKIVANNTNNFVGKLSIDVAKTGYTSRAGRCLTMLFERDGQRYLLVVMGAATASQRTLLVENLLDKIR